MRLFSFIPSIIGQIDALWVIYRQGALMNWFKSFWMRLNTPQSRATATPPASKSSSSPVDRKSAKPLSILSEMLTTHSESDLSNFTPRAQKVMELSRQEAGKLNHNFVGTEHLLLGILKLDQGCAVNTLRKMGLDLETVRAEVMKQVGAGPDQKIIGNIPYTPRVKKVLALASKEQAALHHTYLGTEHILLGLLREGDGVAARIFQNLGVELERTRDELLSELDPTRKRTTPNTPLKPMTPKLPHEPVDVSLRYDIYCREQNQGVVVYRNALFKGVRGLFEQRDFDTFAQFIELELSGGQIIFIYKASVVRFCLPGVKIEPENISGEKV